MPIPVIQSQAVLWCSFCSSLCMRVYEVAQGMFFNNQKAQSIFHQVVFVLWSHGLIFQQIQLSDEKITWNEQYKRMIQHNTWWYRLISPPCLCFNILNPSEAKIKAQNLKKSNKSHKRLVCCIPSGFFPDTFHLSFFPEEIHTASSSILVKYSVLCSYLTWIKVPFLIAVLITVKSQLWVPPAICVLSFIYVSIPTMKFPYCCGNLPMLGLLIGSWP